MTATLSFAIGALLLVAVTLFLLLRPFRRRPAGADFSRQQINAAIYRDELVELEADRAEGSLSQTDYEQARTELQRRLLEDSQAGEAGAAAAQEDGHRLPLMLALALPVAAALLYFTLGHPAALNPPPPAQNFTAEDIERMVAGLAAKLEQDPGNLQGWVMLARSYKAMGRLPDAVRAYERAEPLLEGNADLLLDYADTSVAASGAFTDKAIATIEKALAIDPAHPQGLWLRGTAHYDAERYDKARADWETLLKLLPPGSEEAGMLEANIAEVKALQAGKAKKP
jgi:cytochrome c-type biogenesis protein CcmH